MVEVPLTSTQQGLVVPDAAVLYDIHGDAWVYEDLAETRTPAGACRSHVTPAISPSSPGASARAPRW